MLTPLIHIKSEDLKRKAKKLRILFSVMELRPHHIIIPIILSFFAAAANAIGIGLLIPIAKGITSNEFSFVHDVPVLGKSLSYVMATFQIPPESNQFILLYVVTLVVVFQILRVCITYATLIYNAYWNGTFFKRVSSSIFARFLSFGKLFYDRSSQGELQTTLGFAGYIFFMMNVIQMTSIALFQILFRIAIMIVISWKLTLLAGLILPALYVFIKLKAKRVKSFSRQRTKVHLEIGRETFNILSGIELVKSSAQEQVMQQRFDELHEEFRMNDFGAKSISALTEPAQELIILFAFMEIMIAGSIYSVELSLQNISLFLIFLYAAKGAMPFFAELGKSGMYAADISGPLANIVHVFDDKEKHAIASGEKYFEGFRSTIAFKNLNFSYEEQLPVLQNFTFSVQKNSTVALVGPSGGGKTTTVNLLLRLYDCPPNSIYIDDTDIREFSLQSLQKRIAYVSQESIFFNDTLRMNLLFGLDKKVSDEVIVEALEKARLDDFIEKLPKGLDSQVGDRGVQLSGGQKQRLSIARALLKNSDIFILDEATSSLDSETEQKIQQAVEDAMQDRTAIVIAHRLSTIQNADKIVVIRDGRVAEEGSMKDLLARERLFYKLWQAQQFN